MKSYHFEKSLIQVTKKPAGINSSLSIDIYTFY